MKRFMTKGRYLFYFLAVGVLTALAMILFALWLKNPDLIWVPKVWIA